MRVLVAAPADLSRRQLGSILSRGFHTKVCADVAEVDVELSTSKPDLIVADGSLCRGKFLDLIARHGLCDRAIFISDPGTEDLLRKQLARGRSFSVVDRKRAQSTLMTEALELVAPRSGTRLAVLDLRFTVRVEGTLLDGVIVDISNRGCSARIQSFDGKTPTPGTRVEALTVLRGTIPVVEGAIGAVRHIEHAEGGFRIGIEFLQRAPAEPQTASVTDNPVQVSAMFDTVLRACVSISVARPGLERNATKLVLVKTDAEANTAIFRSETQIAFDEGEVLEGIFEWEGRQHRFWASVREANGEILILNQPKTLVSARNRATQRFQPPEDAPVQVSVRSPITGEVTIPNAVDLTATSVSFMLRPERDLFPVGTLLEDVQLTFANGDSFQLGGKVTRHGYPSEVGGEPRLHCAIEFANDGGSSFGELAARIAMSALPEVSTDINATTEQIWEFLERSGFLYPEKVARLDVPAVTRTMDCLVGSPNDVAKTWLVRHEQRIVAHLSSIRLFQSTWGLQHLSATSHKRGASWASMLNLALADFCEQHPGIEWLRVAYRPNNKWPEHVFGRFAHRVRDPNLSDFRTFSYMTSPTELETPDERSTYWETRAFSPDDLGVLEACLVEEGQSILLPSADVSSEHIELREVSESYEKIGLHRRREIIVAERKGRIAGFALLEISSPGLNLSELTNAMTIHCFDREPALVSALGRAGRRRYRDLGYRNCVALVDRPSEKALASVGFDKLKEYTQWIWHYTLLRSFHRYVSNSFA